MKQAIIRFGLLAVALLLLLKLSTYNLVSRVWSTELMVGFFAILLIGMGVYLSRFIFKPPTPAPSDSKIDLQQLKHLGISRREHQVLLQMARGKSNQEIADVLFISQNTVKTHVSNLLIKLDAKRRTEAISKAREKRII